MTRKQWLAQATERLTETSHSSRLDSEILLSYCLNIDRTHLLASVNIEITDEEKTTLNTLLERRLEHEPIAYITEHKEFYGRDFFVTPDVLVPRPETENLIERALPHITPDDNLVDVGTGSGIIAITIKCERPRTTVVATELSEDALAVARKNSKYHACDITFHHTDLIDGIKSCDVLVANLPYVMSQQETSLATRHEPRQALYSGDDGLNHYRRLFAQLNRLGDSRPRVILCEADPQQQSALEKMAQDAGYYLNYHHKLIYEFCIAG